MPHSIPKIAAKVTIFRRRLYKSIWRDVVVSKILNQAECLRRHDCPECALELDRLAKRVLLGDKGNVESVAAAAYFDALGIVRTNRRDIINPMPNPALNYGYALLRAAVARAVSAAGLLPQLGIHHDNQRNAFCLADDLMEPYRPFVDDVVLSLPDRIGKSWKRMSLGTHEKRMVAESLYGIACIDGESFAVMDAVARTVQSFVAVICGRRNHIRLPELPGEQKKP